MKSGNFLSITEYVGDTYTYWIYTQNGQVIAQSCVQPINEPTVTPDEMSLQGRILKEGEESGTLLWKNPSSTALPEISMDADEGTPPLDTDYEEDDPSTDDTQFDSVYYDLINDDDEVKLFDMVAVTDHHTSIGQFQVQVLWATEEETWEPAHVIQQDSPSSIAKDAKKNNLLTKHGFKW